MDFLSDEEKFWKHLMIQRKFNYELLLFLLLLNSILICKLINNIHNVLEFERIMFFHSFIIYILYTLFYLLCLLEYAHSMENISDKVHVN